MNEPDILYPAIFVFSMLLIGLAFIAGMGIAAAATVPPQGLSTWRTTCVLSSKVWPTLNSSK